MFTRTPMSRAIFILGSFMVTVFALIYMVTTPLAASNGPTPYLVKDVNPDGGANIRWLVPGDDQFFFVPDDGTHGWEVWTSDGTVTGTFMLKDIYPGEFGSYPIGAAFVNNELYFSADDDQASFSVWRSDGTITGTVLVKYFDPGSPSQRWFTAVNNGVLFVAGDSLHGIELWLTDGTAAGTMLLKDINPNESSSQPSQLKNINGVVFFQAIIGEEGSSTVQLWKSDGTTAGTMRVKEIYPGGDPSPNELTVTGDLLFFTANDGINGRELWRSDGTITGTVMVANIHPTASANPFYLTNVGGTLFFFAHDGTHGIELWKSDGSGAGTVLVKDITPVGDTEFLRTYAGDNKLFFSVVDPIIGEELWVSDGTEAGTHLVKDINPTGSAFTEYQTTGLFAGSLLYFTVTDGVHGVELWQSDGTEMGTHMIVDLNPFGDAFDFYVPQMAVANGLLFFAATNNADANFELWALPLSPEVATFTVNSTIDATDANPGDGICETGSGNAVCTVRAAVQEANSTTVVDTIIIPSGIYTITLPGYDFDAAVGDFDVTEGVNILGAGASQTILDGNQLDRIFEIGSTNGATVTISGLTIQNGSSPDPGGGLCVCYDTPVTLHEIVVQNNRARYGAGITNYGQTLLEDSQILNNIAFHEGYGGGIANYVPYPLAYSVSMTIRNTTIRGNQSTLSAGSAGGILNGFTVSPLLVTMLIEDSVIDHNSAAYRGGGISNAGNLQIVNSTLSQNQITEGEGGAIDTVQGTITMHHTTIVSNTALVPGTTGGFFITGGVVNMYGSIVAHNANANCNIATVSLGYNLESANDCGFTSTGDIANTTPLLGPLQDNGGPTWSHSLLNGSPALDAADNGGCPAMDQRGIPRPQDGDGDGNPVCDMGAYEFTANIPIISIGDVSVIEGDINTIITPAVFTITLSVASTQTVTVTYTTVEGTAQAGSDYTFATDTFQFSPGQVTHTVSIDVSGDTVVEPDETFSVVLSNPINALTGDGTGVGTIINDDFIIPDITISDYAVSEGNSGTTMATFTVTLATVSNQTVTMTYTTADGTAQAGTDYAAASGQIVFTPGQSSYVIMVLINGDTVVETDEIFTVELLNVINGTLVDGLAVGTILNDDVESTAPPTVYLPLVVKP